MSNEQDYVGGSAAEDIAFFGEPRPERSVSVGWKFSLHGSYIPEEVHAVGRQLFALPDYRH